MSKGWASTWYMNPHRQLTNKNQTRTYLFLQNDCVIMEWHHYVNIVMPFIRATLNEKLLARMGKINSLGIL